MLSQMTVTRMVALACICGGWGFDRADQAHAERFTFHHVHVLGTSLEVQVEADSESAATAAEDRVLKEIARQEVIFSTYAADSELSRWQQTRGEPARVSPELLALMQASDEWRKRSHGAFNPATEVISRVWKEASQRGSLPTQEEVAAAVQAAAERPWRLDPVAQTAIRLAEVPVSFNAMAKGHIVEAACNAALKDAPQIHGLLVNLGGDLRVCGDMVQRVAIVDPFHPEENAMPLTRIFVHDRAIATSGNYRRGFKIGEQWFSHIIDPRTGQPVEHVVSATVIARSSADADALATICNVLPVNESLTLVESRGAECLLITRDGKQHTSSGWAEFQQPQLYRFTAAMQPAENGKDETADEKKAAGELLELLVKFELNRTPGAQYRRPYVAVWLEDAKEFPVRTGLLFMLTRGNGSRWHRDLLRWYRQDTVRKRSGDRLDLIDTLASASRGPGEYQAMFDGLDDSGKPLKPGKYTLFIEVAREKGTYQIIRQPLELGGEPIKETSLKSNVEIKSASFEYRKPVAGKNAAK